MSVLLGYLMMIYGGWRAFVNYGLFAAAEKEYGSWRARSELPNYGLRIWLWIGVALFGIVLSGIFGGGIGCGSRMNPC